MDEQFYIAAVKTALFNIMSLFQKKVKSPCQLICTLDEDRVCVGCYRSSDEIADWDQLSEDEKKTVIELTNERRTAKGGSYYGFG